MICYLVQYSQKQAFPFRRVLICEKYKSTSLEIVVWIFQHRFLEQREPFYDQKILFMVVFFKTHSVKIGQFRILRYELLVQILER